jgi:WD40 repeat protein
VSWSEDEQALRLWDTHSGRLVAVCEGHDARILGAAPLPGGAAFISWSFDEFTRLWDSRTGDRLDDSPDRSVALVHPDWVAARARATGETLKLVRLGLVAWASGPTAGISPDRKGAPCLAVWHGDSIDKAWELLEDGTLAVSLKGGRVAFLKLYRGPKRADLAAAFDPASARARRSRELRDPRRRLR